LPVIGDDKWEIKFISSPSCLIKYFSINSTDIPKSTLIKKPSISEFIYLNICPIVK
jgi:hypothetical protein